MRKRGRLSHILMLTSFLSIALTGCLNVNGDLHEDTSSQVSDPDLIENTQILSFSSYREGDFIKFYFILGDRKAHNGTVRYIIEDESGKKVYDDEFLIFARDYVELAKCTQEFCGIEKVFEWQAPAQVVSNWEEEHRVELVFTGEDGGRARTSSRIEIFN